MKNRHKYVLLEAGEKLRAGDEYFQYGIAPFDWRKVEESAFGVRLPPLSTGNFPAIHRRKAR